MDYDDIVSVMDVLCDIGHVQPSSKYHTVGIVCRELGIEVQE